MRRKKKFGGAQKSSCALLYIAALPDGYQISQKCICPPLSRGFLSFQGGKKHFGRFEVTLYRGFRLIPVRYTESCSNGTSLEICRDFEQTNVK
jgi:hypothetical protein